MADKIMTMAEAVELIKPDSMLALGGMTIYRRPMAYVLALYKRFLESGTPRGLTLLAFTAGIESDILVGARMVSTVRTCYFGLEIFGLAPMYTYFANRGEIEILEETEASLAFGLRAQMAGVGFMPGRGWIGTDLPRLRPDVHTVQDPYSGEEYMAFPAIRPDVAVIHTLQADPEGNATLGGNWAVDKELALVSGKVILTAEEIVPELAKADLVAPLVDAIIPAPGGARPTSCHPLYPIDGKVLLEYTEAVADPESFAAYMARWMAS